MLFSFIRDFKLNFSIRILFAFILFISGFLISFLIRIDAAGKISILESLDIDHSQLFVKILFNNILVTLFGILGIYVYGLTAIAILFSNGFFIGYWLKLVVFLVEDWQIFILKRFLPHSIEIISIILAGSVGLKGIEKLNKKDYNPFDEIKKSKFEIFIAISIITASAILESYVSTRI